MPDKRILRYHRSTLSNKIIFSVSITIAMSRKLHITIIIIQALLLGIDIDNWSYIKYSTTTFSILYSKAGIIRGWKLSRIAESRIFAIKTFANCGKRQLQAHALITTPSYSVKTFAVKALANCPQTWKFAKVFTRERFPLYCICTYWLSLIYMYIQRGFKLLEEDCVATCTHPVIETGTWRLSSLSDDQQTIWW